MKTPLRPEAPSSTAGDITILLESWSAGEPTSQDRLFERVYPELRQIAAKRLRGEPHPPSIQATELVGETFLRLVEQSRVEWRSRSQFFALSATLIRRILVDRAKSRRRLKRGAGAPHLSIDLLESWLPVETVDVMDLDEALAALAKIQARTARLVELRFFGGLSIDETSDVLSLSKATVVRRWRFAKAWLKEWLETHR